MLNDLSGSEVDKRLEGQRNAARRADLYPCAEFVTFRSYAVISSPCSA
jgi:hypothetical protein